MLDMIHISETQNPYIRWLDEFHNRHIILVLNIVQFVEILFNLWYNKVSETNTF